MKIMLCIIIIIFCAHIYYFSLVCTSDCLSITSVELWSNCTVYKLLYSSVIVYWIVSLIRTVVTWEPMSELCSCKQNSATIAQPWQRSVSFTYSWVIYLCFFIIVLYSTTKIKTSSIIEACHGNAFLDIIFHAVSSTANASGVFELCHT